MPETPRAASIWTTSGRRFQYSFGHRTAIMGILNRTPDSFSDGGRYWDLEAAVARAWAMVEEGADILDVGGESTRPGHQPVDDAEELRRVIPLIERLAPTLPIPISIDTSKPAVAWAALEAGADMLNDVHGLRQSPDMARIAAEFGVPVVVMHNSVPEPSRSLMADVVAELAKSRDIALAAGVAEERILADPGIGFGKTAEQNLEILRRLPELACLGRPVLVGTSRKSTIGKVLDLPVEERLEGTAATVALSVAGGAAVVRVHDVRAMARVARMSDAIVRGWQPGQAVKPVAVALDQGRTKGEVAER